jgi:hypothetical protein
MFEDNRISSVKELLLDYVRSPSLRHIRDIHAITKLAQEIVARIDRGNSIWRKWDGQRETLLKGAIGCWVPPEDLREFLNLMPGPKLSKVDVEQRLKALEDEDHWNYARDEVREGCLALYRKEKAEGTELPATVRALAEYVEQEKERIRLEQEERFKRQREEERVAQEQRLLSGADCKWTQLRGSPCWYCRANGRTFRLSPNKEKMWELYRVTSLSGEEKGTWVGKYGVRGDATKAVKEVAYKPEPRW